MERISGPSSMSAPGNLEKGSTTSFTDTWSTCMHVHYQYQRHTCMHACCPEDT